MGKKESDKAPQSALDWALDHALAVTGLLALVIYGVARAGIDGFYGQLHVTPEEVGLTQTIVTGRAALAFVKAASEAAAFGALVTSAVALLLSFIRSRQRIREGHPYDESDDRRWRISLGILAVAAVGPPVEFLIHPEFRHAIEREWVALLATVIYVVVVIGIVVWSVHVEHRRAIVSLMTRWSSLLSHRDLPLSDASVPYLLWRERERPATQILSRALATKVEPATARGLSTETKIALIGVLALGATLLLALSRLAGTYEAQFVIYGRGYDPNRAALSVRGDPVCLRWSAAGSKALRSGGPYMYLGENNNTLVLFNFVKKGTRFGTPLRIPASGVSLHIATYTGIPGDNWACPAPGERASAKQ